MEGHLCPVKSPGRKAFFIGEVKPRICACVEGQ